MTSVALLVLRLVTGGLLAGHGAQKLFGKFGGYGIAGTGGYMESLGLKPGQHWARLAGASEFGGGVLTALGLLSPIGPITMLAPMAMATGTAHAGKPIWVTSGGAELPVTNMAVAGALAVAGPGKFSLDSLLGIHVPWWMTGLAVAGTAAGIAYGLQTSRSGMAEAQAAQQNQAQGNEQSQTGEPSTAGADGATAAGTTARLGEQPAL